MSKKITTSKSNQNVNSSVAVLDQENPTGVAVKEKKPRESKPTFQLYLNWDGGNFSVRDLTSGAPKEGDVISHVNNVIVEGMLKRVPAKEKGSAERREKGLKVNHNWIQTSTNVFFQPEEGTVFDDSNSKLIDLYMLQSDEVGAENNETGRFFISVDKSNKTVIRKLF